MDRMKASKICSIMSLVILALSAACFSVCLSFEWTSAELISADLQLVVQHVAIGGGPPYRPAQSQGLPTVTGGVKDEERKTNSNEDKCLIAKEGEMKVEMLKLGLIQACMSNRECKKTCVSISELHEKLPENESDKIKYVQISFAFEVTALLSTLLAFLAAILKTPCLGLSHRNVFLAVTIIFSIVGVFSGVAGLVVFDQKVYKEDFGLLANRNGCVQFSKEASNFIAISGSILLICSLSLTLVEAVIRPAPTEEELSTDKDEDCKTTAI